MIRSSGALRPLVARGYHTVILCRECATIRPTWPPCEPKYVSIAAIIIYIVVSSMRKLFCGSLEAVKPSGCLSHAVRRCTAENKRVHAKNFTLICRPQT